MEYASICFLSGFLLLLSVAGLLGGLYLLILVMTPNIPALFPIEPIDVKNLDEPKDNRVYIPKIGVVANLALLVGQMAGLEHAAIVRRIAQVHRAQWSARRSARLGCMGCWCRSAALG